MSFLGRSSGPQTAERNHNLDQGASGIADSGFSFLGNQVLDHCANLDCRSSWIHLFRRRARPAFEGGWTCSPQCTEAHLLSAFQRELVGHARWKGPHRHRIPLGLLMVEQGWLTAAQLRQGLAAQRAAGTGRLGDWLVREGAVDEVTVARALGIQWSCPVLAVAPDAAGSLTSVMPRIFIEAFGGLPIRRETDRLVYLGFEQSLDPVLALAVSRMSQTRVECAVVASTQFAIAQQSVLSANFPAIELAESLSESAAAQMLARSIERFQPADARLVRVHDCLWLRMWKTRYVGATPPISSVRDVVCAIGSCL